MISTIISSGKPTHCEKNPQRENGDKKRMKKKKMFIYLFWLLLKKNESK